MDTAIKDTGLIISIHRSQRISWKCYQSQRYRRCTRRSSCKDFDPAILIPFIIAALIGDLPWISNSCHTTAASLTAPLMASISVSPILLAAFLLCRSDFILLL